MARRRRLFLFGVALEAAEVEEDAGLVDYALGVVRRGIETPGPTSPSVPLSMKTRIRPDHVAEVGSFAESVPTIGLTFSDHRVSGRPATRPCRAFIEPF